MITQKQLDAWLDREVSEGRVRDDDRMTMMVRLSYDRRLWECLRDDRRPAVRS